MSTSNGDEVEETVKVQLEISLGISIHDRRWRIAHGTRGGVGHLLGQKRLKFVEQTLVKWKKLLSEDATWENSQTLTLYLELKKFNSINFFK